MVFDFKEQLKVGDAGEQFLLEQHPNLELAPDNERTYDIRNTLNDQKLEVKTDTYDFTKTPNFFMEHFTRSADVDSPGGPWRALRDGVHVFVYLFNNPRPVAWWFHDIGSLVGALDTWRAARKRWVQVIKNNGYSAHGYLVKRKAILKHVKNWEVIEYDIDG